MSDLLTAYRDHRATNRWATPRDWVASVLGNAVLRLATPAYRALVGEALHRGLRDIATKRQSDASSEQRGPDV